MQSDMLKYDNYLFLGIIMQKKTIEFPVKFSVSVHWCHIRQSSLLLNCVKKKKKNLTLTLNYIFICVFESHMWRIILNNVYMLA